MDHMVVSCIGPMAGSASSSIALTSSVGLPCLVPIRRSVRKYVASKSSQKQTQTAPAYVVGNSEEHMAKKKDALDLLLFRNERKALDEEEAAIGRSTERLRKKREKLWRKCPHPPELCNHYHGYECHEVECSVCGCFL